MFGFPSGANNSARYLAISYAAVPILEMIGLKVSLVVKNGVFWRTPI